MNQPARWIASGAAVFLVFGILLAHDGPLAQAIIAEALKSDFGKLYASSRALLEGRDAYGGTNLNPPHAHLPLLVVVAAGPAWAVAAWAVASLLCLLASMRIVWLEAGHCLSFWTRRLAFVGLVCLTPTWSVIATWQVTFLLLLPMTLAWRAARHEDARPASVWLGIAMSMKPFLGMFLVFLACRRRWASTAVAAATAAACYAVGLSAFGLDAHVRWIAGLGSVTWAGQNMNGSVRGVVERALSGSEAHVALTSRPELIQPVWLIVVSSITLMMIVMLTHDHGPSHVDRGFAVTLLSAQLVSPLGWVYYLWLAVPPTAGLFATRIERRPSSAAGWIRNLLLLVSVPALVWPLRPPKLLAPSLVATLTTDSVYFWATFLVWAALVADWFDANRRVDESGGVVSTMIGVQGGASRPCRPT